MAEIDLEMLEDRLLVEPIEPAAVSAGGIIIPDMARKHKPTRLGRVLAVGPGKRKDDVVTPMVVAVGDEVAYEQYVGYEYVMGRKEYRILSETDVLAKVER